MGMQDIGLKLVHELAQARGGRIDDGYLFHDRQLRKNAIGRRGSMKLPPTDGLSWRGICVMLRRRELQGIPAHPPLFAKDTHRSKDVAALER